MTANGLPDLIPTGVESDTLAERILNSRHPMIKSGDDEVGHWYVIVYVGWS
jgi:hypothetical protein